MPSKSMSPSSWECKEGCKPSKDPCKHLEKLLPRMDAGLYNFSINKGKRVRYHAMSYSDVIDSMAESVDATSIKAAEIEGFKDYLSQFSLAPIDVDVLICRYVFNWTFEEIGDYMGVGSTTAWKVHEQASQVIKDSKGE